MTEWRLLANLWNGSYPPNDAIKAQWEECWSWRDAAPDRKLAARPRLELVAAGARGEVDLDGFGPWNAQQSGWKKAWEPWRESGAQLLFNILWTQDPRLVQVPRWLGYWNVNRSQHFVQLQSYVMDTANPEYQEWIVPRIERYVIESRADAIHVGLKWDRLEKPTIHYAVPGGILDTRTGAVQLGYDQPDTITPTNTLGFSDGSCEILRRLNTPFFTALQLVPPLKPDGTLGSFTKASYETAARAWMGPELEALWLGPGEFVSL